MLSENVFGLPVNVMLRKKNVYMSALCQT